MTSLSTQSLSNALELLEMVHKDSGLRWVKQREKEKNPYLFLALEQAASFDAIAVYFRFFDDGRPPRPQIYIYQYESLANIDKSPADIHHRLWNSGIVPYCFIYKTSEILVFNCCKTPDVDANGDFITSHHDTINLLSQISEKFQEYSARQFDSGLFWDSEKGKDFHYNQSAYEQLLKQLKSAKQKLIIEAGINHAGVVKRLLVMLILIKYLEERQDDNGTSALNPDKFYTEFNPKDPTLSGVLKNAATFFRMLDVLCTSNHFNGEIFKLTAEEKSEIKEIDLAVFKQFVQGDTEFFGSKHGIGQVSMWKLYSFNYLPIELISHIYEDFLADENGKKKDGVVYTPPYLVQFLVDQCMPLDKPQVNFKILDPACGSGIFLVGAYKRLIQWWRKENNWEKPKKKNIKALQNLLLENIFGCDIEAEAVRLTYFSLSLALLDALSPREIWESVHFDNLINRNLFPGDFFSTIQKKSLPRDFDLIIGNPPFTSEFTKPASEIDITEKRENIQRPGVPDNQIALLFLEQSLKLLKQGGNCCLILSSGPLLYNTNVHEFKKYLFTNYQFKFVYDFTPLRATLFKSSSSSAKPAALAVLAENKKPKNTPVYHLIFRRTRASGEKIEFEIDHYDIQKIDYKDALEKPRVWQINFLGGGRLHSLMDKISEEDTLEKYLKNKVKNNGWKVGEGWIEAPDSKGLKRIEALLQILKLTVEEENELFELQEKYKADWITGKAFLETDDFDDKGIAKINNCNKKYFYRSAKENKEIFQPPHLLIKESVKDEFIPVLFSEDYLTFKDKIFGVHSPEKDKNELKRIEKYLKTKSNTALIWLLSGQVLTNREGVPLKSDILSIPYPEKEIVFNYIERILLEDIISHYSKFRKEGEKSIVLNKVTNPELIEFGDYYCRILNSVYKKFKPLKPIIGNEFICYPFVLGTKPEMPIPATIKEVEPALKNLLDKKYDYNLWVKRILRVYAKNVIFLYKPNQKRYWLRSIAIRDADETFVELYKQGK